MSKYEIKHLYTEAGGNLPAIPFNVYPRPQLKRDSFFCLNGKWSFDVPALGIENAEITVPFAPESLLSGINRSMGKRAHLFYRKSFALPSDFKKDRVILHFGAVDQIARISLNGAFVGEHIGGYLPFSFDITDHLIENNELTVEVIDDTSDKTLPYGKQRLKRGGMWYTPVSGIWQTVWLESVPSEYIKGIRYSFNDNEVKVELDGVTDGKITVFAPSGELEAEITGGEASVTLTSPRLWSSDDPYLYRTSIISGSDTVESYFAVRTVDTRVIDGIPRICLNGKPIFLHALLDQGYFSDGIYTPASPELYENDILTAKSLGYNTLRKHIKIEPQLFYYYCDKYGMLVMQDMVNNGSYSFIRDTALPTVFMKYFPDFILNPSKKVRRNFIETAKKTVELLYNHPSVIYYTVFNEGWGQFNSAKAYKLFKKLDNTRVIDTTSGWFKTAKSDVVSHHVYFKPVKIKAHNSRPTVVSEFGGYSFKHPDHCANSLKTYGYSKYEEKEAFEEALTALYINEIVTAVEKGLCGAVYTQLSDVEDETNGLISYDRRYLKVTPEKMRKIADMLKTE